MKSDFENKVENAESMFDKLISFRIMIYLLLATIILIVVYGQLFTAILLFLLFWYYRMLINKYKMTVFGMLEEKKNRKEKK
jgi:hypothetical protein